jgi:hypothetical protein
MPDGATVCSKCSTCQKHHIKRQFVGPAYCCPECRKEWKAADALPLCYKCHEPLEVVGFGGLNGGQRPTCPTCKIEYLMFAEW